MTKYDTFNKVATIAWEEEHATNDDIWVEAWHGDEEYDINVSLDGEGKWIATAYHVASGVTDTDIGYRIW